MDSVSILPIDIKWSRLTTMCMTSNSTNVQLSLLNIDDEDETQAWIQNVLPEFVQL